MDASDRGRFVECAHLRDKRTRQAEAVISLGEVTDGEPQGVLLCVTCWLQVTGAVLSEIAQNAVARVVREDGLEALTRHDP